ncbi:hypothetical protein [Spirosoma sordidisoli]|uniref:M50 family peptidase n=1 Tax=Spirosoma sordidisoli TaxID=2502893 RepID=A0A4Q2UGI8_9BACT|nr:hypothetical protein [Spirosoma sordidisoli]RYC68447.1 hypothetical protein EQG79_18995 [Spirosoma sordidisoli]
MNSSPQDILRSVILAETGDKFVVQTPERSFHVGRPLFYILKLSQQGHSPASVREQLAAFGASGLSQEAIEKALTDTLAQITAPAAANPGQKYIQSRIRLLSETQLARLASPLRLLFTRYVFLALFLGCGYLTVRYGIDLLQNGLFQDKVGWTDGFVLVLASYVFLGLISFLHEIGHAAAALRYGIRPKEVGFGFYLIFPVLYTDVTRIWILKRTRRVLVNLSGIYVQLLINAGLIGISLSTDHATVQHVVHSFFLTNTFIALYSLNPYLRNDGYWIVSDLFDVPNLSRSAYELPRRAYQFVQRKGNLWPQGVTSPTQRRTLVIYTSIYWLLLLLLPLGLYRLTLDRYDRILSLIEQVPTLTGGAYYETVWTIVRLTLLYGLVIGLAARMMLITIRGYRTA